MRLMYVKVKGNNQLISNRIDGTILTGKFDWAIWLGFGTVKFVWTPCQKYYHPVLDCTKVVNPIIRKVRGFFCVVSVGVYLIIIVVSLLIIIRKNNYSIIPYLMIMTGANNDQHECYLSFSVITAAATAAATTATFP